MDFLPDFEKISLAWFKNRLAEQELLPSRKILHEDLDARFAVLDEQGISTLAGLIDALKTKKKLLAFADQTSLPEDYLTILRREANSYMPKAVNLNQFSGVDQAVIEKLADLGIKQSFQLIKQCQTKKTRQELAQQVGLPEKEIIELLSLADVTRVNGVGPVFAQVLLDAGIQTSVEIAQADSKILFGRLKEAYLSSGYDRADFTERDIVFCIEMAELLPPAAEF